MNATSTMSADSVSAARLPACKETGIALKTPIATHVAICSYVVSSETLNIFLFGLVSTGYCMTEQFCAQSVPENFLRRKSLSYQPVAIQIYWPCNCLPACLPGL